MHCYYYINIVIVIIIIVFVVFVLIIFVILIIIPVDQLADIDLSIEVPDGELEKSFSFDMLPYCTLSHTNIIFILSIHLYC